MGVAHRDRGRAARLSPGIERDTAILFVSTRHESPPLTVSDAMLRGLAPDGGLYMPEVLPRFTPEDFDGQDSLAAIAHRLLTPFFEGDPLHEFLREICAEAFNFPAPLKDLADPDGALAVLELFHGPTAAFKDFGARFLAACMQRCAVDAARPITVLVATSGDTGGAVAAGFHGQAAIDVAVLYPQGRVSRRQEQQLTCWSGNVHALCVLGDFDACQRIVKGAFSDDGLNAARRLCSANSINIGRLLPQMVYYAAASLQVWRATGARPGFVVPTGNLGNACACLLAREAGLPIGDLALATNANRTIPDFLESGEWRPRPSVATLASAMDVGNPSNMERVRALVGESAAAVGRRLRAFSATDAEIEAQIRRIYDRWGEVWCPHTATAAHVLEHRLHEERDASWIIVATAHPAKFETVVEPLIGREVAMPPALAALMDLPSHSDPMQPTIAALRSALAPENAA